jgi:hypothetical protein
MFCIKPLYLLELRFYENIDEYNFIKFDEQINHISFMKISYNIV